MSEILETVLAADEAYAQSFGDKGRLALPPVRGFAILTCMDGAARSREVCRARRGGCARHSQCRRAGQRRRDPLAGYFLQAIGNPRMVRHSPPIKFVAAYLDGPENHAPNGPGIWGMSVLYA
jgi:hypothetical protein